MGVMFIGIAVVIKELVGKAQVKQHLLIKDLIGTSDIPTKVGVYWSSGFREED
jgi:hypothetical protein